MPATINKQRVLTQVLAELPKGTDDRDSGKSQGRPVLEQFLFAVCREGTTREKAEKAFRTLRESYFDWNEIRVSGVREVADAIAELPRSEARAQRIIGFLQEVFETTFSFDLEGLQKKGLKEAAKKLDRFEAANDYSVAWVVQQSLGGHAIPVDPPTLRVARRMGLVELDETPMAVRAHLEHIIPKAKGTAFTDFVSKLADDFCLAEAPQCTRCSFAQHCPKLVNASPPADILSFAAARAK